MSENDLCAYENLFDTIKKAPNKFFYLFVKKTVEDNLKATALQKLKELLR